MRSIALALLLVPAAACAAAPARSFMGPTATGSGIAMVAMAGGGPDCHFTYAQFLPLHGAAGSPPAESAPKGVAFRHGIFDFAVTDCAPGAALEFTITYPGGVAGASYWKYGPTKADSKPHWYAIPARFQGDAVTFTIVDGGLGDDDLKADGRVLDPGGPGIRDAARDELALGPWPLWLLVTILGVMGLHPASRRRIAEGIERTVRRR